VLRFHHNLKDSRFAFAQLSSRHIPVDFGYPPSFGFIQPASHPHRQAASGANWIPEIKHGGYRRNLAKFATEAMRARCA
jgi:hypothetical protein